MARHRFGSGQYRYFSHDLPAPVRELREAFLPPAAAHRPGLGRQAGQARPLAGQPGEWLGMCHEAGQDRSAQILLRYGPGDWNALHRDVFGDMLFPAPGRDRS
ncbi:hypothetical protein E4K10_00210 [Streptomyces sp. T1317-0309]|nr:hypothetical protein E4K10_00210 [Streptomyces sp. T1317-0309]